METIKLNPIEKDYSNRIYNEIENKLLLLLPDEEIIFKIKMKELTTLRMYFEAFNTNIAKKENTIKL